MRYDVGGIAIAASLVFGLPAWAQTPPASPVIPAPPGNAQQDLQRSDHAFDAATGHKLVWDAGRKSWIDTQLGQAVGFQGAIAKDGTVIPAPAPFVAKSGAKTFAKQDPKDAERAYNAVTGQTLVWDRAQSTWIDTRSTKNVGFQGGPTRPAPTPPREARRATRDWASRSVVPSPQAPVTTARATASKTARAMSTEAGCSSPWWFH